MKIAFLGGTHLGRTYSKASALRGCECVDTLTDDCKLCFVARDVDSAEDLPAVSALMQSLQGCKIPVILMSQVPPGFTRPWTASIPSLYYQVDTIIMRWALERAAHPKRIIVGLRDYWVDRDYSRYLNLFSCKLLMMRYESAELAKLAINFILAAQVSSANTLNDVAKAVGADWNEIIPALQTDERIGQNAYLRPGIIGGHLPRDVRRIQQLVGTPFADAIGPMESTTI